MVSKESVNEQLNSLGFNIRAFTNRGEVSELPSILIPDETIFECANGYYEGGFALLLATNIRVLLVDKKPLNFLTVEDLRFDMINQIDYSHRLLGAQISISVGSKNLTFRSYNKLRLRKLINHVQHCIADVKKQQNHHQEGQFQHLEQINQRLQEYLQAQYQNQQMLHQQLQDAKGYIPNRAPIMQPQPITKPSPELSDYLFAQSLLRQYEQQSGVNLAQSQPAHNTEIRYINAPHQTADLYAAGRSEIFTKYQGDPIATPPIPQYASSELPVNDASGWEINPLRIAYAKLPMALRLRRNLGSNQVFANQQRLPGYPTP